MKLENFEKATAEVSRKKYFEHAATCMKSGVTVTFAFRGATESLGGQVLLVLDEQTANTLRTIFNQNVLIASKALTALGIEL